MSRHSQKLKNLAHNTFVRTNRRAIVVMFVRLSGTGVRYDHGEVNVSADLSLRLDSPMLWAAKAFLPTPNRLFTDPPAREVWYGCTN